MIDPLIFCSLNIRSASLEPKKTPFKLTSMTRYHSFNGISIVGKEASTPALFTQMST